MADPVDGPPPPRISMPSTMHTDTVDAAKSSAQTDPLPPPGSKSLSLLRLPPELALYVSGTDDALLRLNKLLITTAGLETILSTLNYSCYLLTFLYARSPSRAKLTRVLSRFLLVHPSTAPSNPLLPSPPPTSKLANLTALLTNTRTTLRLTALLPLYAWLRTLLSSSTHFSSPPDPYLHAIALTQCLAYILYQALENIAHLIDLHILPLSITTSRYNPFRSLKGDPSTSRLWLISSRFWLVGVSCDILRLLRDAYVEAQRRRRHSTSTSTSSERGEHIPTTAAEAEETDRRWWSELFVAGCWLPMCAHYSVDGGLFRSGVEDGMVGVLGLAASWEGWKCAWAETRG